MEMPRKLGRPKRSTSSTPQVSIENTSEKSLGDTNMSDEPNLSRTRSGKVYDVRNKFPPATNKPAKTAAKATRRYVPGAEVDKVTTLVQFCNTTMPLTLQQLKKIMKINPVVVVKDCANKAAKRVAKKSTIKLPMKKAVARKSTTKLPYLYYEDEEIYSHYGKKPTPLDKVTTLVKFGNTMIPITLQKLSAIIKINPVVLIKDCKK